METKSIVLETHILHEITSGNDIQLSKDKLKYFSREFNTQYNLLREMKATGVEISADNLKLYSIIKEIPIDPFYNEKSEVIDNKDIDKLIDIHIIESDSKRDVAQIKRMSETYDSSPEVIAKMQELVNNLASRNKNPYSLKALKEVAHEQLEFISNLFDGKEIDGLYLYRKGRSKQFMKLNYRLKYIDRSDLVIIGAKSHVGKTSFMLSLANVLSKNDYKGLIFSLEQTAPQLLHRMTLAKSGLSHNKIFSLEKPSDDDRKAYYSSIYKIADLPLTITDTNLASWFDIKKVIIENKDKIDYVMIDHLTFIPSYDGEPSFNTHKQITDIVRDMKSLAKEIKIPIIALSQLNRVMGSSATKKGNRIDEKYLEPFMRDLRESGSIEEYADKILMMWRNEDEFNLEKSGIYTINVKVEKNRTGTTGTVQYLFYGNMNRWKEIEEEKKDE